MYYKEFLKHLLSILFHCNNKQPTVLNLLVLISFLVDFIDILLDREDVVVDQRIFGQGCMLNNSLNTKVYTIKSL